MARLKPRPDTKPFMQPVRGTDLPSGNPSTARKSCVRIRFGLHHSLKCFSLMKPNLQNERTALSCQNDAELVSKAGPGLPAAHRPGHRREHAGARVFCPIGG